MDLDLSIMINPEATVAKEKLPETTRGRNQIFHLTQMSLINHKHVLALESEVRFIRFAQELQGVM